MSTHEDSEVQQVDVLPSGSLGIIVASEISQQITTAKAYPRDIKTFRNEAMGLATMNEDIADECFYALPRAGKSIQGPSVRLAEIVAHAWGNCRAGSRVIEEGDKFVTAQGLFHDLETNVAVTYEVRRRIVDKHGKRYNADMIATTANAACSIALRNAVFKGVPKAYWSPIYEEARRVAIGDIDTLANKRMVAINYLLSHGVTPERVFAALGVKNEEEITLEHLATLKGTVQSIGSGEYSIETAFPEPSEHEKNRSNLKDIGAKPKDESADDNQASRIDPEDIPQ